jgi:hypothetical protein
MKAIPIIKATAVFLISLLISCDDILVEDISDKEVVLMAPANSVQIRKAEQILLWEAVAGATQYEVFVFSPDLASAKEIVIDTIVTKPTFLVRLPAASYEWCVKASNGAFETNLACHKLIVKEDLSERTVTLVSPPADHQNNKTTQHFLWNKVPGASQYNLIIVSPNLASANDVVVNTTISKNSFSWDLPVGDYEWCVTAMDDEESTPVACNKLEVTD